MTEVLADVSVEEKSPDRNFGSEATLSVDADSRKDTFIRVRVTGVVPGTVSSARIRLTVPDVRRADSDSGGRIQQISECDWDESVVTFNNRPALDGVPGPDIGPVARGDVVEFDVTSHVASDGTYCFAITSDSGNGVDFSSREAAAGQPELVIE